MLSKCGVHKGGQGANNGLVVLHWVGCKQAQWDPHLYEAFFYQIHGLNNSQILQNLLQFSNDSTQLKQRRFSRLCRHAFQKRDRQMLGQAIEFRKMRRIEKTKKKCYQVFHLEATALNQIGEMLCNTFITTLAPSLPDIVRPARIIS